MDYKVNDLKENIIKMWNHVEYAVHSCTDEDVTFEKLLESEEVINQQHKSIDDYAFKYIALKSPQTKNLRIALASMKINAELERIGDQAVIIKRYFENLDKQNNDMKQLKYEVSIMLNKTLLCLIHEDIDLAQKVINTDKSINELYDQIIEDSLNSIKNSNMTTTKGYSTIRMAKGFERIGDHCTNIAEDVIFINKGEDIRHQSDKTNPTIHRLDKFLKSMDKE